MKINFYMVLILVGFFIQIVTNSDSQTVIWRHVEKGYDINKPSFSWSGSEVTFCRQRHCPDGEEAESFTDDELNEIASNNKKIPRFSDPEVGFMKIGSEQFTKVDWGWFPSFSQSGQLLVYSKQEKPISGFRVLAETLKGNTISVFNRETGKIKAIAVPDKDQNLSKPNFSNGDQYVYFVIAGAVNGAWDGNAGMGGVDLDNGKVSVFLKPEGRYQSDFKMINYKSLQSDPLIWGQHCFVTDLNSNLVDLLNPTKKIYSFKGKANFYPKDENKTLVYDSGWKLIENSDGQVIEKIGKEDAVGEGDVSPDGRKIAMISNKTGDITEMPKGLNEVKVINVGDADGKTVLKTDGFVYYTEWSKNSKQIAVVVGHDKPNADIHDYDELLVIRIDN